VIYLAQNSQNWLNPNTLKIAIWVLIIGAIAVGKIVKAAKEQAELRRQMELAKRAEDEALRLGRPLPGSVQERPEAVAVGRPPMADTSNKSAAQRLEELAAQRRAQIEELRRQRAASAQQGVPPTVHQQPRVQVQQQPQMSPARSAPAPMPARQTTSAPGPVGQPFGKTQTTRGSARPLEKPQKAQKQQKQQKPPQARPVQQPVQQQRPVARAESVDPHEGESSTHRLVPDAVAASSARGGRGFRPGPGDWRRAFIFQELLSPPKALRQE
jgi:hypothetical protein